MEDLLGFQHPKLLGGLLLSGCFCALIYVLYQAALPKPLPGIPYNEDSAKRVTGDIPYFLELERSGKRVRDFWSILARKHNSAITQFFTGPFSAPAVVVADFREAQDLLMRRSHELDRGNFNIGVMKGVIPHHFVAMGTHEHRFKVSKSLQKDLMTPTYLHSVSFNLSIGCETLTNAS